MKIEKMRPIIILSLLTSGITTPTIERTAMLSVTTRAYWHYEYYANFIGRIRLELTFHVILFDFSLPILFTLKFKIEGFVL